MGGSQRVSKNRAKSPIGVYPLEKILPRKRSHVPDCMRLAEGFRKQSARRASAQAMSTDEGSMYMKTLLVSGKIELQSGNRTAGRQRLEQLAREASGKGFGLIADQARKALTIQDAEWQRKALP